LTVSISNRVAFIGYVPGTTISEQLTFTARDPVGSRASIAVTFTVTFQPNQPPVVSSIPGQAADVPASFTPINLDDYVADPDHADAQLTWTVTNNTRLTVGITNRVATIGYPTNTTNSFSEFLVFTATDPEGLSGSTTSLFSVVFLPVDYTIARRGSTNDFRLISSSAAVMQQANTVDFSKTSPPYVNYEMYGYSLASDTQLQVDYRISISATATLGTAQLVVSNRVLNFLNQPLGPLTNHVFNFRIRVTP
jgi:hypothetical protein